ncbi:hypothetical protein ONS96_001566 [Cadophora gregata f. sp. sojae]|nr:hypothetical protein ONS96_001566 [Cadophora gregata f. sp. sojae]
MATSSTNQAQLVTFHQWVARRIQSFDFAAHPVTSAGWTWTLDSDLESYVIDYLAHGRSEAEVTECLSFRNLVRDAPSPSSMTAEHREERERRLLFSSYNRTVLARPPTRRRVGSWNFSRRRCTAASSTRVDRAQLLDHAHA